MDFATESLRQLAAILESDSDCSEDEDDEATDEALLQERAEAQKLVEFEQASQKLLVELSALEAEYEIEKSCREQAEAYAAQVNQENKKLKRISVALFPMLSQLPEDLLDGASEDKPEPDPTEDPAYQHLQQIKELQETVSQLLGEKEELAVQVKELQHSIGQLQEQLEEEQLEKRSLQSTVEWNQKALKRFKQASQLVTQGYGEVAQQPELEQDLRQHTEVFAHQMLVEQKEAKRQSMILKQSVGPDAQLLQALSEVAELTKALEEAKQEHQTKVEAQLATLRASLAAVEEEKQQLGQRLVQAEERNSALEERVQSLEEKAKLATAPSPEPDQTPVAPPPPPPPPLPPPVFTTPVDPLSVLRQQKGLRREKPSAATVNDVKCQAVEEMMARIKNGVVLRPARKDKADASVRRSIAMELQGLLGTMKRPARKSSWRRKSQKHKDSQLESILQRRRRVVDCPNPAQHAGAPVTGPSKAAQAPGHSETNPATSLPPSEENKAGVVHFRDRAACIQRSRLTASRAGAWDQMEEKGTTGTSVLRKETAYP